MDSDSWTTRLLAASRRYQSRSAHGGGDVDGDNESRPELLCPFCAEEFDVVRLCCHIDGAHPVEAKNGVRLQMNPNLRRGAIGEMRKIASEEGITALWKGVGLLL
ncbi:hypothetical protein LOK49_LG01G01704 [Camellia lanceoleosa]|uniref:Uncharacterized protein n=1 Tax=Camellia lanceoleosa TaxID=1840588 RepID=A0ACC0IXC7_9ERIC|nr:hypothetical protein LOK49_LG01G01704 [Camellia lanceoleosa]